MTYEYDEDQMLTTEQRAWCNKLKNLIKKMPEGIELILGETEFNVMQEGFHSYGLLDERGHPVDMLGVGGNRIAAQSMYEINTIGKPIYPNSESM
jgi:hypothetical protein